MDASGTSGQAFAFKSDGTYAFEVLQIVSSTSANQQGEIGTFTSTGNTITLTPQQATCPGKHPVATLGYQLQGDNLTIATNTGSVIYQRDTATPASNIAFTFGCFDANGNFTAGEMLPVSN